MGSGWTSWCYSTVTEKEGGGKWITTPLPIRAKGEVSPNSVSIFIITPLSIILPLRKWLILKCLSNMTIHCTARRGNVLSWGCRQWSHSQGQSFAVGALLVWTGSGGSSGRVRTGRNPAGRQSLTVWADTHTGGTDWTEYLLQSGKKKHWAKRRYYHRGYWARLFQVTLCFISALHLTSLHFTAQCLSLFTFI